MTKMTRTERLNHERLMRSLDYLYDERGMADRLEKLVPEAWHTLEQDIDVHEKKAKITLRLDDSVVRFYRAMGPGYQARMNRILATFAQMKIAEVRELDRYMREDHPKVRKELKEKMQQMQERYGPF